MSDEVSNQDLIHAWQSGDENAAAVLFHRYRLRLIALIRSRLARKLARRVDPDDVLLSAYRSFFVAARKGHSPVPDSDDLWPYLATVTLRKLSRTVRQHTAGRRAVDLEITDPSGWLQAAGTDDLAVEHSAILADEVELLLTKLDATAREVLVRTLRGDDPWTIASSLSIHERTVRRALERIREELPLGPGEVPVSLRPVVRPPAPRTPCRRVGTTTYADYVLQKFLGAGAFSKVYRASERATGRTVAVKFLKRDCWNDDRATTALIKEYEILQGLKHPNLLRIDDWGTTPRGALFLVTEYVDGIDLGCWGRTRHPAVARIVEIVGEVARAVDFAHSHGVLHCDLKPANVMLQEDGRIALCDFGLARYATAPDDVPQGGTAGFLCPEQISDTYGPITERTDVHGIGGLLYALLTGHPPVVGRDLPDIITRVLSPALPAAPLAMGAQSTPELDAIVLKCLQKEPNLRFESARALAEALSSLRIPATG
ncbi:MAG: protein kinase [Planctomycetes bacterium]|nr:protein kinase [Planctomycetota bacterium]